MSSGLPRCDFCGRRETAHPTRLEIAERCRRYGVLADDGCQSNAAYGPSVARERRAEATAQPHNDGRVDVT